MEAIVWHGGHDFRLEGIADPEPGPNRVLVRIEVTAICGSDLHLPEFGAPPPIVPGHEGCGTVVAVGTGVSGMREGDRVALNPVQICGRCYCCTSGIEHLCLNTRHLGSRETAGTWAELVAIDERNAHPIPETVSFTQAALTEPTAVCYQSFRRAGLSAGDTVLVVGDGPFGFLHAQIAGALGAGKVVCAGHYDQRLRRIHDCTGATVVNTRNEDLTDVLATEVGSPGVDIAIEATGTGAAPSIGIQTLRPRGTLVVFSYVWEPEPLDMGSIHMQELNVFGSCRSQGAFDVCLSLMAEGVVDTEALVDMAVPMRDYASALERLRADKAGTFKAVLLPKKK
jgi:threonine dehydrogenase-like Zn-dependent dehydrogenase